MPVQYKVVAKPKNLGNTIRERLAMVLKKARLNLGSPIKLEDEDTDTTILYSKRALSLLSKMRCDAKVTERIDAFLLDVQPLLQNGEPFTKDTEIFDVCTTFPRKQKCKRRVALATAKSLSQQVMTVQDLTKFLDTKIREPLQQCPPGTYNVCDIVEYNSKVENRRHFQHLTRITSTSR